MVVMAKLVMTMALPPRFSLGLEVCYFPQTSFDLCLSV